MSEKADNVLILQYKVSLNITLLIWLAPTTCCISLLHFLSSEYENGSKDGVLK